MLTKFVTHSFPVFPSTSKLLYCNSSGLKTAGSRVQVSVEPPPADFDFRGEILSGSRAAIAESHPQLLDLADNGSLVLIKKSQFGPVPPWRTEFVEPEAIWILGTTHISLESAADVERVIRAVNPDNVVVELCRSRAGIMYTSPDGEANQQLRSSMFSLSGTGFFGAVGRSIDLGGQTALALRILLAAFSSRLSSEVNRPFGDEVSNFRENSNFFGLNIRSSPFITSLSSCLDLQFRAARKAAEEIGAQVVLGDRPIEITLDRAWNSLKWKEKVSLLSSVIGGITQSSNLSKEAAMKEPDAPDSNFQLYEQLSFSYPSLLLPLIHERDTYLAWSLKRSKAVNGSKKVVGVIGKGHMNGVIYSLMSDTGNLRFRDLAGKRNSGDGSGWVVDASKSLIRDTVITILLWLLYEKIITAGAGS
ncbi:OLC1v1027339C1 [Oldenlandia corymbosa var. corymbosa]|uniref:OLC1v1027339C1 n=1 Tax=Oldenlandia corymbosa var. corymbosa TaxID=529605 RepID=A0AAV1C9I4_OLDCO|nr:OLC1v1027339C1 [Oldenlandia corymbosa var. corymbosa]